MPVHHTSPPKRPRRLCATAIVMALAGVVFCSVSGCVTTETLVTNPLPDHPTVAIAPFFNLSSERAVDGRRFANLYYSELQKVPGFDVIPVGVVEQALLTHGLELDDPSDAGRLATLLGADFVAVGAVTEYSPYYPPQVGLKVVWHGRTPAEFRPGVPTVPIYPQPPHLRLHDKLLEAKARVNAHCEAPHSSGCEGDAQPACETGPRPTIRGQNAQPLSAELPILKAPTDANFQPIGLAAAEMTSGPVGDSPGSPVMAYTRLFDAADTNTAAALRDYVELRSDLRGGDWEAALLRSDDYIRFCCHRHIKEMLTLHGGQAGRRTVYMHRRQH